MKYVNENKNTNSQSPKLLLREDIIQDDNVHYQEATKPSKVEEPQPRYGLFLEDIKGIGNQIRYGQGFLEGTYY